MYKRQRLHTPTPIPKERNKFKKMYEKSSNFDYSMLYAAKGIVIKNDETMIIQYIDSLSSYH